MVTVLLICIYVFYIGLGIPDSLLGTAWPAVYQEFGVPISYASVVSLIISGGTILSSLMSSRLIAKLGTSRVTALSTSLTAAALLGFSFSQDFIWLCLFAIPLGIGAGSIDTALNNYVALHYNAMQMNFLHCFYGVGVTVSPYLMSMALSESMDWRRGYRIAFFIQIGIAVLSIISLPLWRKVKEAEAEETAVKVLPFGEMIRRKKIWASCGVFVGIGALEATCTVWGSTFLTETIGMTADKAAQIAALYFAGLTVGRFVSGLLTIKLSNWQLIAGGEAAILLAIILLWIRPNTAATAAGLFMIGLGNGPVFPNMTHLTPSLFIKATTQSVIGLQMAFSYISILLAPVLFGALTDLAGTHIFPVFLLIMFFITAGCTVILKAGDERSRRTLS